MSVFRLRPLDKPGHPGVVFIHIPKTGGSSIRQGLPGLSVEGPAFGRVPWGGFAFAFVREPEQRFLSAVRYCKARRKLIPLEDWIEWGLTWPDWDALSEPQQFIRHHTLPMTHPYNCLERADFVGCFERYEEDMRVALDLARLPQPKFLTHARRTRGEMPKLPARFRARFEEQYARDYEFWDKTRRNG